MSLEGQLLDHKSLRAVTDKTTPPAERHDILRCHIGGEARMEAEWQWAPQNPKFGTYAHKRRA